MFSPAPGYLIRPAVNDDEDLEALRIIGHCLYHYPMAELAKSQTRDNLANDWYLRCAKRPGETMLLTRKGLKDDKHAIVGATRITPDPSGDRDPDTGEVINWSLTAILPDHRGKGLSKPLREAAIAATEAQTIKSRVEKDNPKSWRVAEKMGYQHEKDDGKDRIYTLKITKQRKTAAAKIVEASGQTKAADYDDPRTTDPSLDVHREVNNLEAELERAGNAKHKQPPASPARPGDNDQRDMMQLMKAAIDYEENPVLREKRIRNRGDHDRPTEFGFDDEEIADIKRDLSRTEAAMRGGRKGDEAQEKLAMMVPYELIKLSNAESFIDMDSLGGGLADYLSPVGWGGSRAGRASMLAKSIGEDPGFNVSNPGTSHLLGTLGGVVGGAGIGAGIGALAGNAGVGAGIGGAVGSLAIPLLLAKLRRKKMEDISAGYDEAEEDGTTDKTVEPSEHGFLGKLLFPFSRAYRSGERSAYKKMRDPDADTYTTADQTFNTLGHIPYASLLNIPGGALHNFAIEDDVNRERRARKREQIQEKQAMSYDVPDELIKFAMVDHCAGVPEKGTTKGQKVPDGGDDGYASADGPNAYTKNLIVAGGDVPDDLIEVVA